MSDKIEVIFWPCGTWCHLENLEETLLSKSDDYSRLSVPVEFTDEDIDAEVDGINRRM